MPFADELQLLFTLTLTSLVFASAYVLARRLGAGGRLQAACDGLLLGYVIQYLSVALPGSIGVLNLATMTAVALVACAACWFGALAKRRMGGDAFVDNGDRLSRPVLFLRGLARPDRLGFLAAMFFAAAYVGYYALEQEVFPVFSTDPLVYHLPTAVQWMQTGRLGYFDTWYWNPAATYSPATTSTFMYWLLAPLRNDLLARYVQAVPLGLIFLVTARLARQLGCSLTVAGCAAAAAVLCRPFVSQVVAPKDDLIVTAFFGCAVLSLSGGNPRDRFGPWRAGLAFGMVLACKYTILLVCPLFLFMVDAPFRAIRGRSLVAPGDDAFADASGQPPPANRVARAVLKWGGAVLIALALSMPWYLRTWLATGNPLFPVDVKVFGKVIFEGLFTTERDQQLRSAGGVWTMLSATYHSLPTVALAALVIAYLAALVGAGRTVWRHPLRRVCLIGTPVTLVVFMLASPHHEVRYVFPLLPLLFAAGGYAITRWVRVPAVGAAVGVAFVAVSVGTSFVWDLVEVFAIYALVGLIVAALGTAFAFALSQLARRAPEFVPRTLLLLGAAALTGSGMWLYVNWEGHLIQYRAQTDDYWAKIAWQEHGGAWHYVRSETPEDATIAFANTAYVYPLYGFDYTRKVVYAPVRPEIKTFLDVPRLGDTVPGDLILDAMTAAQNTNADRVTWLANLDRLGAQFVLINKAERSKEPPELAFAQQSPDRLERVYEDDNAMVYRVVR